MERIPPPKPRREQNELYQASRPIPDVERLRPAGRRNPDPRRGAQPLHLSRHTRHGARRIGLSGERGSPVTIRFVQQSPDACTWRKSSRISE